jgi:hypothetical protein
MVRGDVCKSIRCGSSVDWYMRDRSVQFQVSMFVNAIRYPMICVFKGRPWITT